MLSAVAALVVLSAVAALVMLSAPASAETLHLLEGAKCTTTGGVELALPPSYIVEESVWDRLDAEMRRLQDAETRLGAENESLRKSAEHPWAWAASAFAAGIALGTVAF